MHPQRARLVVQLERGRAVGGGRQHRPRAAVRSEEGQRRHAPLVFGAEHAAQAASAIDQIDLRGRDDARRA